MTGRDPREALERLRTAADAGELDTICERYGVRLLGAFGSAVRGDTTPADLDIAVSFLEAPDELGLLDALTELTRCDVIDLAVLDRASPVLRAEGMVGIPLYEHQPGVYAIEQMAALAERRDTEWLRRLDLDALAG